MRRRRMSLRALLVSVLVGVSLASIVGVSVLTYAGTRSLLGNEVEDQLTAVEYTRARAIEQGLDRFAERVAVLAADQGVVDATVALEHGFDDLEAAGDQLDDAQSAELASVYEQLVADEQVTTLLTSAGLDVPDVADVIPQDPAARYLQYYYLAAEAETGTLGETADPGDGSTYTTAHAIYHPFLRSVAVQSGLFDLMIVSSSNQRIIYTTSKFPDLGAQATTGLLGESSLGRALTDVLPRAPLGDAIIVDYEPYIGKLGAPVMFVAAAIRDDQQVVGALVAQLPSIALTQLMTADRRWEEVGLGDTGETYVVGRDLLMRSDSRVWLEEPERYLDEIGADSPEAQAVSALGSTVFVQEVDTEAVRTALGGERFSGRSRDYLGRDTITVAEPLKVAGLDWVVVAQLDRDEAGKDLSRYLGRVLLALAIAAPIFAAVGWLLARRLARPVPPLVDAAGRVAAGDLETRLVDPSTDEYGHLSRELNRFAEELAAEERALDDEQRNTTELLLAALPARVVDPVQTGDLDLGDLLDTATVIALTVTGFGDDATRDQEWSLEQWSSLSAEIEAEATGLRLERAWSSADRHLYLAGLGRPEHGADEAAEFAFRVRRLVEETSGRLGVELGFHAVLASGDVATGVVGGAQMSLGVWGQPARDALALDAAASSGQILVDGSAARLLRDHWVIERDDEATGLSGEHLSVYELIRAREGAAAPSTEASAPAGD